MRCTACKSIPIIASWQPVKTENMPRVEAVLAKKAEGRPITPEEFTVISQFVDRIERGLIYRRTAEKRQEEERRKVARSHVPDACICHDFGRSWARRSGI